MVIVLCVLLFDCLSSSYPIKFAKLKEVCMPSVGYFCPWWAVVPLEGCVGCCAFGTISAFVQV